MTDIVGYGHWILRDQSIVPTSVEKHNWKWTCSNSGMFSFKSAWDLVGARDSDFQ